MRLLAPLPAIALAALLAACGGAVGHDFATDFAAAKANAATLEGGAFDHTVEQRILAPDTNRALLACATQHPPARASYRGVVEFDGSRGYGVRFEDDDDYADCLASQLEGLAMPEPPQRPYLLPIEMGGKAK
jgi:hypothetical protein